jgi:hypothetical protein
MRRCKHRGELSTNELLCHAALHAVNVRGSCADFKNAIERLHLPPGSPIEELLLHR